ncbi:MAG: formyl transferase [Deltaproteobacteria bacterium]|nr:formyl transferase [Deltaproteobacteria bacterium]
MRIIFIGAVAFSRHCLREILAHGGEVVGIVTIDPSERDRHADYADLRGLADLHEIPCLAVRQINDPAAVAAIRRLRPDVIFVFGWSQLLSAEILRIPPKGCIGAHPALLPQHRGRHPIIWTLVEGLEEGALTFFYCTEGADDGDILWQRSFPIALTDTAATVYRKIEALASTAIRELLPQLRQGIAPRRPQDPAQASYWRKRTAADGAIRWDAPTRTTYNLVRALTRPYPGATCRCGGATVIIWSAALPVDPLPAQAAFLPAGALFTWNAALHVRTGDGYLTLREYSASDGRTLQAGEQFSAEVRE